MSGTKGLCLTRRGSRGMRPGLGAGKAMFCFCSLLWGPGLTAWEIEGGFFRSNRLCSLSFPVCIHYTYFAQWARRAIWKNCVGLNWGLLSGEEAHFVSSDRDGSVPPGGVSSCFLAMLLVLRGRADIRVSPLPRSEPGQEEFPSLLLLPKY